MDGMRFLDKRLVVITPHRTQPSKLILRPALFTGGLPFRTTNFISAEKLELRHSYHHLRRVLISSVGLPTTGICGFASLTMWI
jgi:hypothetical protein